MFLLVAPYADEKLHLSLSITYLNYSTLEVFPILLNYLPHSLSYNPLAENLFLKRLS